MRVVFKGGWGTSYHGHQSYVPLLAGTSCYETWDAKTGKSHYITCKTGRPLETFIISIISITAFLHARNVPDPIRK